MDKKEAINLVKQYKLLLAKHFDLDTVYLYGSYAKDAGRDDSDIDVAVVVNGVSGDFFSVNPLLWKLRRKIDDRIEPILIDKNNDQPGFLNEIKRTGIEIE
ncbi:MAG: nucleotidyltransferase domain-containing protein [Bacteroidales bacterium]|nr:nucleotidyltransferase domain-containing protein [Bacteroidales bacterium]